MRIVENSPSSFRDIPPLDYIGSIRNGNEQLVFETAEMFHDYPNLDVGICLVFTGSDGKMERFTRSKTELMVFQNTDDQGRFIRDFSRWIRRITGLPIARIFSPNPDTDMPEVKISTGDALPYARNQPHLVYPDRVLNSFFVSGDERVFNQAREHVLELVTADTEEGNRIRRKMTQEQLRQSMRSLKTGIVYGTEAFTLNPPLQSYDENTTGYITGFKFPALRTVQRALDILTINGIRQKRLDMDQALSLSTHTVERVAQLRKLGILDFGVKLEESYAWFLQRYHQVQDSYDKFTEGIALPFDLDQFLKYQSTVLAFGAFAKS